MPAFMERRGYVQENPKDGKALPGPCHGAVSWLVSLVANGLVLLFRLPVVPVSGWQADVCDIS
jgi:hypothetical protein